MSTVMEARVVISAEDKTAAAFASVKKHLDDLARTSKTIGSGMRVAQDMERAATAQRRMVAEHVSAGRQMAAIGATLAVHKVAHLAREAMHTYREFDKERRYGKAVMGITDEQQKPLVDQAIHGGATSKFNDIQWLEAQRELAARGLNADQVRGLVEVAATLGQAMDKSLPDSVKLLEGAMFGFGKNISTFDDAMANGRRTADLQVKASKISGMNGDDIVQAYKFGATPFRMAGLSESQLLAFAATGKKANMGGDEMGVAARALAANLLKPTAGARTAMMAAGIDYSKYQKQGAGPMNADAFAGSIASSYGVKLNAKAKGALQAVFDDKTVVADAAKFMPRIMQVLAQTLGGADAKSKKSIAGEARRFRDASMGGVDAPALFRDIMSAIAKNPSLANAIFGSKQGGRIATGAGPAFGEKLDELENHSQGYAKTVADERMAGFDGAVSRFEGAVKNLETAVGRAFDNDGKGGFLTDATNKLGQLTQHLAELDPAVIKAAAGATVLATAFAGFKGAEALLGGFGLKGSATALTAAAHALEAAAGRQAIPGGGAIPTAGGAAGGAAATSGGLTLAGVVGGVAVPAAVGALAYGVGGTWLPEDLVKARAELADLNRQIEMYDRLIAGGHGTGATDGKLADARQRHAELTGKVEGYNMPYAAPTPGGLSNQVMPDIKSAIGTLTGEVKGTVEGVLKIHVEAGSELIRVHNEGMAALRGALNGAIRGNTGKGGQDAAPNAQTGGIPPP